MNPVRQWEIVKVRINANDRDEHPAIVFSPAEVASSARVGKRSGLNAASEIVIDKINSLSRERIGHKIGNLSFSELRAVDEALIGWLGLS